MSGVWAARVSKVGHTMAQASLRLLFPAHPDASFHRRITRLTVVSARSFFVSALSV